MKKLLTFLSVLILSSITLSANAIEKVAVVNIPAVVNASSQVKSLKLEQQAKLKELEAWLVTVKSDVERQSTKENKEKLIKKYDAEFAKKQVEIRTNYAKKLQEIDKNINNIVIKIAKQKGYDMVISKNTVLYGGDDITKDIIKEVK